MREQQNDRRYKLRISTQAGTALEWSTDEEDPASSLRITFRIEKHLEPNPNPATIAIYGLSADRQKQLESLRGSRILLEAGYREKRTVIFVGSIYQVTSARDGQTWKTEIRALDGGTTWHTKRLKTTIQVKTTLKAAIETALKDAQGKDPETGAITKGVDLRALKDVPDVEFPDGLTMHGPLKDVLNRICAGSGLSWSIQDEQIQIFGEGKDTGEELIVLAAPKTDDDPGTGLIGTVGRNIETIGIFLKTSLTFTALLDGSIRPGRKIRLESRTATGVYVVTRATFEGDTHGGPWYVQCQSYA